jgi:alpha 1,2-mannosyltransferase
MTSDDEEAPLTYGDLYFNRQKSFVSLKVNKGDEDSEEEIQIYKNKNSMLKFYILVGGMVVAAFLFTVIFAWFTVIAARSSGYGSRIIDVYQDAKRSLRGSIGKERAVILILCRNSDLRDMLTTIEQFEYRFNGKYKYPYVFLNDEPFTEEFKGEIRQRIQGIVKFGLVDPEHWAVPRRFNRTKIDESLIELGKIIHGSRLSYRQMCRWYSGFFYNHEYLKGYDYYWRIEPGVSFTCNIPYDPFEFLRKNGKVYGFSIALTEIPETIPSLWSTVQEFINVNQKYFPRDRFLWEYFKSSHSSRDGLCHFWSNFEIAAFSLFRSREYKSFFDYLDNAGGFFYERWGDAPVHSLALGLFLRKEQIHWFEDIGYRHFPHAQCPQDHNIRLKRNCDCDPDAAENVLTGSCMKPFINNDRIMEDL